jgi:hypothetical protein
MTRYFFDFKSGGDISKDEEGLELSDVAAAHHTALGALIDGLRDVCLEGVSALDFAVEVRDNLGRVLDVRAKLGSSIHRTQ